MKRVPAVVLTLIPFAFVAVVDPKEAVDNPHTHQELPAEHIVETLGPAITTTFTGTLPAIGDKTIAGQFK